MKKKMNKKGVFGLTAVQSFFAVILGIALLAYVIVIIMGTLSGTTILSQSSGSVTNETSAFINVSGYTLSESTTQGFGNPVIIEAYNTTDSGAIADGNWTITNGVVTNATAHNWDSVNISYTYNFDSQQQRELDDVLANTSTGVTGFFSSISPVYAILAILVIILILIVLVRIVQKPGGTAQTPQL